MFVLVLTRLAAHACVGSMVLLVSLRTGADVPPGARRDEQRARGQERAPCGRSARCAGPAQGRLCGLAAAAHAIQGAAFVCPSLSFRIALLLFGSCSVPLLFLVALRLLPSASCAVHLLCAALFAARRSMHSCCVCRCAEQEEGDHCAQDRSRREEYVPFVLCLNPWQPRMTLRATAERGCVWLWYPSDTCLICWLPFALHRLARARGLLKIALLIALRRPESAAAAGGPGRRRRGQSGPVRAQRTGPAVAARGGAADQAHPAARRVGFASSCSCFPVRCLACPESSTWQRARLPGFSFPLGCCSESTFT